MERLIENEIGLQEKPSFYVMRIREWVQRNQSMLGKPLSSHKTSGIMINFRKRKGCVQFTNEKNYRKRNTGYIQLG